MTDILFRPEQLDELRQRYSEHATISTDAADKLGKFLDPLPSTILQQLVDAKIRFVSVLARNRLMRRKS